MRNIIFITLVSFVFFHCTTLGKEYECYTDIYKAKDTLTVYLTSLDYCDSKNLVPGNGFLLCSENMLLGTLSILWGHTTLENSKTKYYLYDFDNDGISEVLTLFLDVSNVWGFVHRIKVDTNYNVSVQSLEIPYSSPDDDVPLNELLSMNPDGTITLLSKTYETKNNLTIFFDSQEKELSLKESKPIDKKKLKN